MASSISAGTTSATALVHTADTSGALELKTNNGTTALTLSTAQNATFAGTLTTAANGIAKASLPTGGVLQVLQGWKTNTFSTASTSLQDVSGLSVTITPTSSSSKFLIMVNMTYLNTYFVGRVVLLRNSTEIGKADAAGSRPIDFLYYSNSTNGGADGQWVRESMDYLDSPATSSSITYKIQVCARTDGQGGTFYINRSNTDRDTQSYDARGVSSIVVMEIAA
jgi:hypothetical protein